jgi:Putative Flp pilus-assembly TadE/G-like
MRTRFLSMLATWVRSRTVRHHGTRGQVLPLIALATVILFSMAALAVDVGYWRYQQRLEQSAADSAAIAGAIEHIFDPTTTNVRVFARADATANGYNDDSSGDVGGANTCATSATVCVTVNAPPATGNNTTDPSAVEVIVAKKQPLFLAGITGLFGANFQWVSTRAVARNVGWSKDSPCIATLNPPTAPKTGISFNGGGSGTGFLSPNCGIVSNGPWKDGGKAVVTAPYIGASSGVTCAGCTSGRPLPATPIADPCLSIGSCAYLFKNPPTSPIKDPAPTTNALTKVITYSPGEYTAAGKLMSFKGTNNVVFSPGLYILDGGLTSNGSTTITAIGVTLYNGGTSAISLGGTSDSIDLVAPSAATCLALTTCNYQGIAIYQPSTNPTGLSLNGGGADGVAGLIYAPTANLTLNGNDPDVTGLIVGAITINGGGITVNNTGGGGGGGNPAVSHIVLAE